MKKKAIIFTLDAILALLISGTLIMTSLHYFSKTENIPYTQQSLYKISLDSLAVLEKDETLKTAVEENSITQIQSFLDSLPEQICSNITVYNTAQNNLLSAEKTECSSSDEKLFVRRVFVANDFGVYYAEMVSWFK